MSRNLALAVTLAAGALAGCATYSEPMRQGIAYYNEGRFLAARDAFDDAIALDSRSAAAWSNRAVARVRLGDLRGAIQDYDQALRLAPGDAEIYFNRGNALVAAGHYPQAVADFTRAWELSPGFAKALFNRGSAKARLGDLAGARADWQEAIAAEPDPWARSGMARSAEMALRPVPPVAASVEPNLTLAPPPPPGTTAGGVPLPSVQTGPVPDVAAASPRVPLTATPELDPGALASRAIAREMQGDRAGARADLQSALAVERDPRRRASLEALLRALDGPR
jgi:tetratricopeptide (TPR) repeat protein